MTNNITDVPGFRVGHAQDMEAATGCTVILCPPGTVGGVDVRGSAAGTRQIDSLNSAHFVDEVHAVLLSGGSAFGLDASGGVMKFLEEQGIGYPTSAGRVPIVPTAIIYDLGLGNGRKRPDREMGYLACVSSQSGIVAEGSVGVGTGATVGKLMGVNLAMKGGVGTTSLVFAGGLIVAALVAVNAFGDIIDPADGKILAGARNPNDNMSFLDSTASIKAGVPLRKYSTPVQNTTLGVIATNARLSKREITKVAQMAQTGLARVISPLHSTVDGDLVFALSGGDLTAEVNAVGIMAGDAIAAAVIRAVTMADGLGLIPAHRDLIKK